MPLKQTLETSGFQENYSLSNWKIFLGIISVAFTAGAYLNGKEYPENVPIIGVCLIGYFIFSTAFWVLETYIIADIFFTGETSQKQAGFAPGTLIEFSSEIKDKSAEFTLILRTKRNNKWLSSSRVISLAEFIDSKGVIDNARVDSFMKKTVFPEAAKSLSKD